MWEEVKKILRSTFSLLKCTSNEVFVFSAFCQIWKTLNIRSNFRANSCNFNLEKLKYICFETLFWMQYCFFENFPIGIKEIESILLPKRTFNKDIRKNISEVAGARRLVLICL